MTNRSLVVGCIATLSLVAAVAAQTGAQQTPSATPTGGSTATPGQTPGTTPTPFPSIDTGTIGDRLDLLQQLRLDKRAFFQ